MINTWSCDSSASTTSCYVTSSSTPDFVFSTSSILTTRDSGDIIFGLGIIIFLQAVIFCGFVFTSFGLKSR